MDPSPGLKLDLSIWSTAATNYFNFTTTFLLVPVLSILIRTNNGWIATSIYIEHVFFYIFRFSVYATCWPTGYIPLTEELVY